MKKHLNTQGFGFLIAALLIAAISVSAQITTGPTATGSIILTGSKISGVSMKRGIIQVGTNVLKIGLFTSKYVTNRISGNNESGVRGFVQKPGEYVVGLDGFTQVTEFKPATEKWQISTILNRSTLVGTLDGIPFEVSVDRFVSSQTNRMRLKQEWEVLK